MVWLVVSLCRNDRHIIIGNAVGVEVASDWMDRPVTCQMAARVWNALSCRMHGKEPAKILTPGFC